LCLSCHSLLNRPWFTLFIPEVHPLSLFSFSEFE
jgi:hypothetical protein